jgi:hypothetical protein
LFAWSSSVVSCDCLKIGWIDNYVI